MRPLEWAMRRFSEDLGIDLGTANTLVTVRDRGIVVAEPSVVAVRRGTNQVLLDGAAVGATALEYLGRTPPGFEAIRPMRSGVIADFEITEAMLRYFIRRAHGSKRFIKPQVVIAVPWGITKVEKRTVISSAERGWCPAGVLGGRTHRRRYRRQPARARTPGLHGGRHRRWNLGGGSDLAGQRGRSRMSAGCRR